MDNLKFPSGMVENVVEIVLLPIQIILILFKYLRYLQEKLEKFDEVHQEKIESRL